MQGLNAFDQVLVPKVLILRQPIGWEYYFCMYVASYVSYSKVMHTHSFPTPLLIAQTPFHYCSLKVLFNPNLCTDGGKIWECRL